MLRRYTHLKPEALHALLETSRPCTGRETIGMSDSWLLRTASDGIRRFEPEHPDTPPRDVREAATPDPNGEQMPLAHPDVPRLLPAYPLEAVWFQLNLASNAVRRSNFFLEFGKSDWVTGN